MNLLIADDEFIIREGLKSLDWNSIGITEVFSASNGIEAKASLDANQIDLAIFDIRMPGLTGIELAKYIRDQKMPTSVVFLTGYEEFEYARKAISYDVKEYIVKPFRPREITAIIEKLIDQKREEQKTIRENQTQRDIYAQICRYFEHTDETSKRIIQELAMHYKEELLLETYAERFHFTPAYLSRKLRQDTGCSFLEIIKAIRLTYVIQLILYGMKISEACYQSGFQDQRYFSQVFKGVFEYSPSELKSRISKPVEFSDVIELIKIRSKHKKELLN